jgi:Rad3-related DNA helicase
MIPTPADLGLQIDKWRPGQEDGFRFLQNSTKRSKVVCAPTGYGKSYLLMGYAIQSGLPTCIVTSTRGLQNQYMSLGKNVGMVDIRGRNNYTCSGKADATCEEGYASRCPYKGTPACDASAAEMRAAASPLVVTNYAKWCRARKFGQGMSHFQQVIFDEGHDAPDQLAAAMQVVLYQREIEKDLKVDFPPHDKAEDFANWKEWARATRAIAELELIKAQARIQGLADPKLAWVKHFTHMRNLVRRLAIISTAGAKNWIVEEINNVGYQFDPIRPAIYAESALLLRVPHIIFASATIRPKTMFMTGIGKEHFDFKEFDSDFDPKRCPIYYVPTMRVDNRAGDFSPLWTRIDQTLARRRNVKGMIQTTSYDYQKGVRDYSRYSDSMMLNMKGEPPTEMIEQFGNAGPGTVLVSPTVGTGYDFPDDMSRFNIVLKIPFDPPSKIVKAREADDKEYRPYRAVQSLIQKWGRDVRSKKDWSERFIFDDHASWFIPRYGHLAPSSFHMFYRQVDVLPQPPKGL